MTAISLLASPWSPSARASSITVAGSTRSVAATRVPTLAKVCCALTISVMWLSADGSFITLGALEPQFYALLLQKLDLHDVDPRSQYDSALWPALKLRFTALFKSRTRDAWCTLLEGSDVCFAPVLTIAEATVHPHNVARGVFTVTPDGAVRAAGAPRFAPSTADTQG